MNDAEVNGGGEEEEAGATSEACCSSSIAITTTDNGSESASSSSQYVELTDNFYVESKRQKGVSIAVQLTVDGVLLRRVRTTRPTDTSEQLLRYADIVGSYCGPTLKRRKAGGLASCRCNSLPTDPEDYVAPPTPIASNGDNSAYLYIYAYLKYEKPLRRVQVRRILRFRAHNSYADNLRMAEHWHCAIRANKLIALNRTFSDANEQRAQSKELLILLNPKSGAGKGREAFQRYVVPILRQAQMPYDLRVTTHSSYAQEFVRTCGELLQRYAGIVVASGDGLFYETLNGLLMRSDWRAACSQLPLGILPCGSGNGLARSLAHHTFEPYEPKPLLNAALHCVSRQTTPLDIVRVDMAAATGQQSVYSFLSIGWGLIADIDIESERLRSIGSNRFTLWAIHRLVTLRSRRGRLSYLPLPWSSKQSPEVAEEVFADDQNQNHDQVKDADINANGWRLPMSQLQSPGSTIPPLSVALSSADGWSIEEDDYVLVHAAYTTHLAEDCYFAPDSRLNDGVIWLVVIRAGIGRPALLSFLLNMGSGTHLPKQPDPYIRVIPVRALRIEPFDGNSSNGVDGIITIDGERVDYVPLQAEIIPGVLKLMARNG